MHWLTIVVLIFLLITAWEGWRKGLIRRVLELVGLVLSIVAALRLVDPASTWLFSIGLPAQSARIVGWLLIFVVCMAATRFVAWTVSKMLRASLLGWVDRWGGALLGLCGGLVLASVLLMAASHVPGNDDMRRAIDDHAVPRGVYAVAPVLYGLLVQDESDVEELWDRARQGLDHLPDMSDQAEKAKDIISDTLDGD